MQSITVDTNLTLEDWRALQMAASRRLGRAATARRQWTVILTAVAIATGAVYLLGTGMLDAPSLALGAAVVLVTFAMNWRLALRRSAPTPGGTFLGPCTYELDGLGLRAARAHSNGYASWNVVNDVTFTGAQVLVWVDRLSAFVIPTRDLPDGLTGTGLAEWIASARAQSERPAGPFVTAKEEPRRRRTWQPSVRTSGGFVAHLRDLTSLAALRGKPVLATSSHELPAALTTLLALGTWAWLDRVKNGPDAVFYPYGASDVAWYLLGGLAVAWLLARLSRPPVALASAIVVCAFGAWLAMVYSHIAPYLSVPRWVAVGIWMGAVLYALAYVAQAARALTGRAQARAPLAVYGAIAVFFWSVHALYVYPMLWVPNGNDDEDYGLDYRSAEPVFFAQRDRIDAALTAVPASDPAATELFFVGFAGFGGQHVFAEEIKFAARVVAERYPQDRGSVLLINDNRDVESAPLATKSTLRYALRGIATKMTLDDDVLFLALSSHGSHDWKLSVTNGSVPLAGLTPTDLAAALDDAGIEWRVIVISACFAGGFIDALKNPKTIVLAAAASDRTSFGCANERELTYFGEALYRDALPGAPSLRDAFASAQAIVAEHESAEGIGRPSDPKAFFGAELERKLAALE